MNDFFRDHTCGQCAWAAKTTVAENSLCRRTPGGAFNFPFVRNTDPACPGFIAKKKEAQA